MSLSQEEAEYGRIAVELGFLDEEQLRSVTGSRKLLADAGNSTTIAQICLRRGWINEEQHGAVLSQVGGPPAAAAAPVAVAEAPVTESTNARIGTYELLQEALRDASGVTWFARRVTDGRQMALHVLSKELTDRPGFAGDYAQQMALASAIDSPYVLVASDWGKESGQVFSAGRVWMRWRPLDGLLKSRGRFTELDALRVALQVSQGLCALHGVGVLHRAIGGNTVALNEKGKATLLRIGQLDHGDSMSGRGDVRFCSPEQAMGQPATTHSDIYATGAVLWTLLTGMPPFNAKTPEDVLRAHREVPLPPIRDIEPSVSADTAEVLQRMLAKDPRQRFESALAMTERLEQMVLDRLLESAPSDIPAVTAPLGGNTSRPRGGNTSRHGGNTSRHGNSTATPRHGNKTGRHGGNTTGRARPRSRAVPAHGQRTAPLKGQRTRPLSGAQATMPLEGQPMMGQATQPLTPAERIRPASRAARRPSTARHAQGRPVSGAAAAHIRPGSQRHTSPEAQHRRAMKQERQKWTIGVALGGGALVVVFALLFMANNRRIERHNNRPGGPSGTTSVASKTSNEPVDFKALAAEMEKINNRLAVKEDDYENVIRDLDLLLERVGHDDSAKAMVEKRIESVTAQAEAKAVAMATELIADARDLIEAENYGEARDRLSEFPRELEFTPSGKGLVARRNKLDNDLSSLLKRVLEEGAKLVAADKLADARDLYSEHIDKLDQDRKQKLIERVSALDTKIGSSTLKQASAVLDAYNKVKPQLTAMLNKRAFSDAHALIADLATQAIPLKAHKTLDELRSEGRDLTYLAQLDTAFRRGLVEVLKVDKTHEPDPAKLSTDAYLAVAAKGNEGMGDTWLLARTVFYLRSGDDEGAVEAAAETRSSSGVDLGPWKQRLIAAANRAAPRQIAKLKGFAEKKEWESLRSGIEQFDKLYAETAAARIQKPLFDGWRAELAKVAKVGGDPKDPKDPRPTPTSETVKRVLEAEREFTAGKLEAQNVIVRAIRSKDLEARREAARILIKLHSREAYAAALDALDDPDLQVREFAFTSLRVLTTQLFPYARLDYGRLDYRADATEAERQAAIRLLRRWYRSFN